MKQVRIYPLVLLSLAVILLLSACGTNEPDATALSSAATSSHTGAAPAVHMQLKNRSTGAIVCYVYNTSASTKPTAQGCPHGTWKEQLFDRNWKQIRPDKIVTVGGPNPGSGTSSHTGAAPAVHMQLKNSSGGVVCKAYNTSASQKPTAQNCPHGTWTEQLFNSSWRQIRPNKTVTVGGDNDRGYQRIFTENFNGSSLSSNWQTPNWPESYRPADYRRDQCVVSGGLLRVRASLSGNQVRSCYAHTNQTFGPGSGQLKIQYRVNVSRVQAEGGWFAAWLHTLSPGKPYDGNPATGTEIDVMEYVPFNGAYRYSSNGIDTRNSFHPAVHIAGNKKFEVPGTNGNGFYDANRKGINIRSGWHTFGLEWNGSCQVFSIDGQPIWKNRQGVSSAQVHRLMLTMEMDNAGSDGYNLWGFASGRFADNLRTRPAEAIVNWVRVDRKSTPDPNLCN